VAKGGTTRGRLEHGCQRFGRAFALQPVGGSSPTAESLDRSTAGGVFEARLSGPDERQRFELLRHVPRRPSRPPRRRKVAVAKRGPSLCGAFMWQVKGSASQGEQPWKSPRFASSSWKKPASGCKRFVPSRSTTALS